MSAERIRHCLGDLDQKNVADMESNALVDRKTGRSHDGGCHNLLLELFNSSRRLAIGKGELPDIRMHLHGQINYGNKN